MVVPFVLANAMAVAQDGFQGYLSENQSSFLRNSVFSRLIDARLLHLGLSKCLREPPL